MVVNTYGKNIKITKGLQEAAEKEAKKIERYIAKDAGVSVNMWVENKEQFAEFSVMYKGLRIISRASGCDMYAALGKAADTEERNLRRLKEKKIEKHRKAKLHPLSPDDLPESCEEDMDDDEFADSAENMPF